MSHRKKLSHKQKVAARMVRAAERPPSADDLVDWARSQGIPDEAIENYGQAFTWAADNPADAEELLSWDEELWKNLLAGVAFPERFHFPEAQVRTVVTNFRTWNILSGFKYTFDWTTPIAQMSVDEIIAQIRHDVRDGKIAVPPSE